MVDFLENLTTNSKNPRLATMQFRPLDFVQAPTLGIRASPVAKILFFTITFNANNISPKVITQQ
jgi:hypothetical protein